MQLGVIDGSLENMLKRPKSLKMLMCKNADPPQPPLQYKRQVLHYPEGPSTQYFRSLVPKTIRLMAFGTRDLKHWVLGPSGLYSFIQMDDVT